MGYRVLYKNSADSPLANYGPRRGLEGPWLMGSGRVLYYDPVEGRYWDPRTDFYLDHEEFDQVQAEFFNLLTR